MTRYTVEQIDDLEKYRHAPHSMEVQRTRRPLYQDASGSYVHASPFASVVGTVDAITMSCTCGCGFTNTEYVKEIF